jgi:coenzyme F420-reducing hydrogenase delta subunit
LLDEVGLGAGRLEMYNMSSAQGQRFAEVAREMTEKIRALGPSPIRLRNAERGMRNSEIRNPKSAL